MERKENLVWPQISGHLPLHSQHPRVTDPFIQHYNGQSPRGYSDQSLSAAKSKDLCHLAPMSSITETAPAMLERIYIGSSLVINNQYLLWPHHMISKSSRMFWNLFSSAQLIIKDYRARKQLDWSSKASFPERGDAWDPPSPSASVLPLW